MPRQAAGTLIARFAEPGSARHALRSLSRAGVDGVEVSLVGSGAAHAERDLEEHTSAVDRRASKWFSARVGAGIVVGGAVAALLALLAGSLVSEDIIIGLVLGLVAAGMIIGGYIGGVISLPLNQDMDLTFADWGDEAAYLEVRIPATARRRMHEMLDDLGADRVTDLN